MKTEIKSSPSFAYICAYLEPGESIFAESDAMSSMAADLDMHAQFNGGLFSGIAKKFFGGESLFVNRFTNNTSQLKEVTLVQPTPGDIKEITLENTSICLQPGAYIASTPGVKIGVRWAGFTSWIAREGLFKLVAYGRGKVFYGAFGSLIEKNLDGEYLVDTSHLVAYEPTITLKLQLAGGLFSSFFGGEGFVTRLQGKGKYVIQTRSLDGLRSWLNSRI